MGSVAISTEVGRFSARHIVFFVPLILLHLGCALVLVVGISDVAIATFLITASIQAFGITTGYHRLLSHRSYKTSRAFQFMLALFGAIAGQNGPLWWVGHHRNHHRYSDQEGDAHSPHAGFFWSHMGWLFSPRCVAIRHELVADLARFPELRLLEDRYYLFVLGYVLLLYVFGEAWQSFDPAAGTSGFQVVVWCSVLNTVCIYHIIWSANSFCHRFGTRRFATRDNSRNNLLVALLTLGDGWHHNHHFCPSSARHGFRWWEIDINYAILRVLAFLGIVWDINEPPPRAARNVADRAIS